MNISLPSELKKYLHDKVDSGLYSSISEVVRESLRLMRQHEAIKGQRLARLNQEIETGLSQLEKGERIDSQHSQLQLKALLSGSTEHHR